VVRGKEILISEKKLEALTELGLRSNQAKIFLSLVNNSPLTVRQISKSVNVPAELIYRTMPTLEKIGLVERIITAPVGFKAIPARTAVGILLKQRKKEYTEAQKMARQLIADCAKTGKTHISSEPTLILLPLGERLENAQIQFGNRIKERFCVVTHAARVHPKMVERFTKILRRNIKVQVVVEEPESRDLIFESFKMLLKNGNFECRFYPSQISAIIALSDNNEVFICERTGGGFLDSRLYWSDNYAITGIAKAYFEKLWSDSTSAR
jgi:sugar-specific transcriptional regulator TrmB